MRYFKPTTQFALPLAFALTLGAAPQPTEAGVCSRLNKPNGCVTSADVKNDNLKAKDLKDEAGGDFVSNPTFVLITSSDQTVESVSITAPRPGMVIVNASGWFFLESGTSGTGSCSITTGSTVDPDHEIIADVNININNFPWGATRGFDVLAGTTVFNLVCSESGNIGLSDLHMTALYVPTRY